MTAANRTSLILCVDDYKNILEGWKLLLESAGYRVLTAADGNSAMQEFISHPVEEVILDYELPGITGDVIARHMKALKPSVPILMVSGDGQLPKEQLEMVDDFLLKAASISIFLERIRTLLNRAGLRRDEDSVLPNLFRPKLTEAIEPTQARVQAA